MKGGLMKRIGKVLLSTALLFTATTGVWAEEEIELTEETEEVTEITEEENEETVEEEVIIEEETEEEAEEIEEEIIEEETVIEEETETVETGGTADLLGAKRVSFVNKLYMNILNRTGSSKEVNYYADLLNGKKTAAQVVASFVESKEYQSKYPGDRQYISDMYEVLLERSGSEKEIGNWLSRMEAGQTYRAVLAGIINSTEFKNVCAASGIEAGSYTSPKAVDQNLNVTKFIAGLYTKALGRKYDAEGLENWASKVRKGLTGAKLIESFVQSTEFQSKKRSDADYIRALYTVILNRSASDQEVSGWQKRISIGQTRRAIEMGLVNSNEFKTICQNAGITRGVAGSPNAVDQNVAITEYVGNMYKVCFGRKADAAGLESWVRSIISGKKTAAGVATGFFNSPELIKKKLSNTAFVKAVYQAVLGRTPTSSEVSGWVKYLKTNERKALLKVFYQSEEFKNKCKAAGMRSYQYSDVMPTAKASAIVAEALKWVGRGIYRNGGSNPATGTDCSGFTQYIFAQFGIQLNRAAAAQALNGVRVTDPKPGDLVLWTSHAAIYIGGGRIVAAANPWQGIKISYVSQVYTPGRFLGYYRVTGVE